MHQNACVLISLDLWKLSLSCFFFLQRWVTQSPWDRIQSLPMYCLTSSMVTYSMSVCDLHSYYCSFILTIVCFSFISVAGSRPGVLLFVVSSYKFNGYLFNDCA